MAYYWGSGLGESLGDSLVSSTSPLYVDGTVYWVHSSTGSDSNGGTERLRPLATLSQAITNATDGDIIVLLSGHTESIGSQLTINKRLTIAGAGSSGGVPTVKFTRTFNGVMFAITAVNVSLRNLYFEESTTSSASARITASFAGFSMLGCYAECGENDVGPTVTLAADYPVIESSTFISVATGSTSPYPPIYSTSQINGIWIRNCICDGGTKGFKHGSHVGSPGIDMIIGESIDVRIEGHTNRNGADLFLDATGGFVQVGTATGGGMVAI